MSDEIRTEITFGQTVRIIPLCVVEGHRTAKHVEWVCPFCGGEGSGLAMSPDGEPLLTPYFSVFCGEHDRRVFIVHCEN